MHTLAQLRSGDLAGLKRLDLSEALAEFPREIFQLADSLEILNLSDNALSELPPDLHRLKHLRVLFCSNNRFTELPTSLGECQQLSMVVFKTNRIEQIPAAALPPNLRWLTLTDNRIETLPEALGECRDLQKLLLAGNRLRNLPSSLANCQRLELLRIASNHLSALPDWLFELPSLAWLGYAGNPCAQPTASFNNEPLADIDWSQLRVTHPLGEGACGVIHQADWHRSHQPPLPVALKLYKGAITSDGSPQHEMAASIAAGHHPNLIRIQGRLKGHPEESDGLVMALIDQAFSNLAEPPSLASCSRDSYAPHRRFSVASALNIAAALASAGAHLHARGICHGDFYAHNVLVNRQGDCLLGDFGAASFHPLDDSARSHALQKIEVRAFGILFGELLERLDNAPSADELKPWHALQQRCVQADIHARPDFGHILQQFANPRA